MRKLPRTLRSHARTKKTPPSAREQVRSAPLEPLVESPSEDPPPKTGALARTEPAAERGALARPFGPGRDAIRDPATSYLARLAPGSRRTQAGALRKIVQISIEGSSDEAVLALTPQTFPWHQMSYAHAQAFLIKMEGAGLKFTTRNRHIAALRGVLKEAWRLGLMTAEDHLRVIDALKTVKGFSLPKGRMLEQSELSALMQSCIDDVRSAQKELSALRRAAEVASDESRESGGQEGDALAAESNLAACLSRRALGLRDAAMLTLLRHGLRRHEVVGALLEDFQDDVDGGAVLTVVGKGNKARTVFFNADVTKVIRAWLSVRPDGPAKTLMTHAEAAKQLTTQAVFVVLAKRAKLAGLKKSFSSHDFRRTFISKLLDSGIDLKTTSTLVGHADVNTTARYDRRGDDAKRRAVSQVKW